MEERKGSMRDAKFVEFSSSFDVVENALEPPQVVVFKSPKPPKPLSYTKWDNDITIKNWKDTFFPLSESLGTKRFKRWYEVFLDEKDQMKVDREINKYIKNRLKESKKRKRKEHKVGESVFIESVNENNQS